MLELGDDDPLYVNKNSESFAQLDLSDETVNCCGTTFLRERSIKDAQLLETRSDGAGYGNLKMCSVCAVSVTKR